MYDLPALDAALAGTIFAGRLHFAPVTGSTNSDALAGAAMGAAHGSVFFADAQQAGRGRGGHVWLSAAGEGLYVSVLLRPALEPGRLLLLPLAAGLAAARAVNTATGLTVDLRWPNDLLIGPRKVGGILVETRSSSNGLPHAVVVGTGINVHQRAFDQELSTPGSSLEMEAGEFERSRPALRQELLIALLRALEREVEGLEHPEASIAIPQRVKQASTWIEGRRVCVHGPQACMGTTAGLDENGFLRVVTAEGVVTVQTGGIREAEPGGQRS